MVVANENEIVHEVIRKIVECLRENEFPLWRVYLFGSFANGHTLRWSDIDVSIFYDREEVDSFDDGVALMLLSSEIDTRIEPHAFGRLEFDNPDPFVAGILKTGKRIL